MGIQYYAVNHSTKTYYELGKRLSFWQIERWPATIEQIRYTVLATALSDDLALRTADALFDFGIEEIVNDYSGLGVEDDYVCVGSVYTERADTPGLTWSQNRDY